MIDPKDQQLSALFQDAELHDDVSASDGFTAAVLRTIEAKEASRASFASAVTQVAMILAGLAVVLSLPSLTLVAKDALQIGVVATEQTLGVTYQMAAMAGLVVIGALYWAFATQD